MPTPHAPLPLLLVIDHALVTAQRLHFGIAASQDLRIAEVEMGSRPSLNTDYNVSHHAKWSVQFESHSMYTMSTFAHGRLTAGACCCVVCAAFDDLAATWSSGSTTVAK